MKTFLKQYLLTWIKFLVMTPLLVFGMLCSIVFSLYSLSTAVLLGDSKTYNDILDETIERMRL